MIASLSEAALRFGYERVGCLTGGVCFGALRALTRFATASSFLIRLIENGLDTAHERGFVLAEASIQIMHRLGIDVHSMRDQRRIECVPGVQSLRRELVSGRPKLLRL